MTATQSLKLASQIYKGSKELVSHSGNRTISLRDKHTDFNVRVEWVGGVVGVFLPEEEYQTETVPPQSGNPPCLGVRQIKSGKCPISQENAIYHKRPMASGTKKVWEEGDTRVCALKCIYIWVCVYAYVHHMFC